MDKIQNDDKEDEKFEDANDVPQTPKTPNKSSVPSTPVGDIFSRRSSKAGTEQAVENGTGSRRGSKVAEESNESLGSRRGSKVESGVGSRRGSKVEETAENGGLESRRGSKFSSISATPLIEEAPSTPKSPASSIRRSSNVSAPKSPSVTAGKLILIFCEKDYFLKFCMRYILISRCLLFP